MTDPSFKRFIVAVVGRAVATWHGTEGWFAFAAYFTVLVLPFLATGFIAEVLGDFASVTLSLLATGWLVVLFLIIAPYRVWRDEYTTAAEFAERMKPKIKATYDDSSPACHKQVGLSSDGGLTFEETGISIRARIESD